MVALYVGDGGVVVPVGVSRDRCVGVTMNRGGIEVVELQVWYTRMCSSWEGELLSGFGETTRRCGSSQSE